MPEPSAIDWPEDLLGCPLRASYRSQSNSVFNTIAVQDGPARYRLISSDEKLTVNVSFLFTADQMAIYEAFFHDTIDAGSLWFNMRLQTGLGMIPHVCHCTQDRRVMPDREAIRLFRVEFDVEAYSSGWVPPPPFTPLDPVDGRNPGDLPADIYDGRNTMEPRPTDSVNSLTPVVYV